jgi:ubiquinone/menaquinone biosynthesis C-methylase UbiE
VRLHEVDTWQKCSETRFMVPLEAHLDPQPRATRAAGYDLLIWLRTRGRERRFRERLLSFARLQHGESILDVGCGTGTLAIAAKHQVGPTARVDAIDASPQMIARARKEVRKADVDITFHHASAEALPFADAQFDVVPSTVMIHHLNRRAREQCAGEIRRVLKPGGRLLVVDFGPPSRARRTLIGHFHRHGHTKLEDIIALLTAAGLQTIESGAVGIKDLHFVVAARRSGAGQR